MRIGYKVYNNTIQQTKPKQEKVKIQNENKDDKIQIRTENQYRQHFKNLDGSIIQSNGTDILQLSRETVEALKKSQSNESPDLEKNITEE